MTHIFKIKTHPRNGFLFFILEDEFMFSGGTETLEEISKRLRTEGFMVTSKKWIMPAAILSIEEV